MVELASGSAQSRRHASLHTIDVMCYLAAQAGDDEGLLPEVL